MAKSQHIEPFQNTVQENCLCFTEFREQKLPLKGQGKHVILVSIRQQSAEAYIELDFGNLEQILNCVALAQKSLKNFKSVTF